jgi:hypothetical protein
MEAACGIAVVVLVALVLGHRVGRFLALRDASAAARRVAEEARHPSRSSASALDAVERLARSEGALLAAERIETMTGGPREYQPAGL